MLLLLQMAGKEKELIDWLMTAGNFKCMYVVSASDGWEGKRIN